MTTNTKRTLAALGLLALSACSASPEISVGNEIDGSVAGASGASGHGGTGGVAGFGGGNGNALTVHIEEPPSPMAIEIVTISCADECADVIAVASGGNPSYTFMWNDGVTTAARELCVTSDTTFTVTVNDTPIEDGEFPYAGQTTTANVTADVIACPSDGGVDAGSDAGMQLPNACSAANLVTMCNDPAVQINVLTNRSLIGGQSAGLVVTGMGNFVGGGWHYEVWGSDDGCSLDEQLAAFQLANGPIDVRRCFTASRDYAHVLLVYRLASTDGLSLSTWNVDFCDACQATP